MVQIERDATAFLRRRQLWTILRNGERINRLLTRLLMDPQLKPVFEQFLKHWSIYFEQADIPVGGRRLDIVSIGIDPGWSAKNLQALRSRTFAKRSRHRITQTYTTHA